MVVGADRKTSSTGKKTAEPTAREKIPGGSGGPQYISVRRKEWGENDPRNPRPRRTTQRELQKWRGSDTRRCKAELVRTYSSCIDCLVCVRREIKNKIK